MISFRIVLRDGDDFFPQLAAECKEKKVKQGAMIFVGAFREATLIGTCEPLQDAPPIVDRHVDFHFAEYLAIGSVVTNPGTEEVSFHVHVALGERFKEAEARNSHLVGATVQYTTECFILELLGTEMTRLPKGEFGLPTLGWDLAKAQQRNPDRLSRF